MSHTSCFRPWPNHSTANFLRQITVLPSIPDGLTPILSYLGEGWRIGKCLELQAVIPVKFIPDLLAYPVRIKKNMVGTKNPMETGGTWT